MERPLRTLPTPCGGHQQQVLPFGKHKGKPIDRVNDGYLQWVLAKYSKSSRWGKAAAEVLRARGRLKQHEPELGDIRALLAEVRLCSRTRNLEWGRRVHAKMFKGGNDLNVRVATALLNMYAKCGSMVDARQVFDKIRHPDVVSWNVLLSGYAENGEGLTALNLFRKMKSHGCAVDPLTYVAALKACISSIPKHANGRAECLKQGREVHSQIGCHMDIKVQSSLIGMYSKCGSMVEARQVFDSIVHPDVVSWNVLLLGYTENEEGLTVLDLFQGMQSQGYAPDSITYVAVLKACALLGALEFGRNVHTKICDFNGHLVTCLVDFYAKCGSLAEAHQVFDLHSKVRDVTTWTALLAGYSNFGETSAVFELFEEMQDASIQPDGVTFVCILVCCSHGGLIEKAMECFEAMSSRYRVNPTPEHYNCLVDVLVRANKLDDAIVLLQKTPCSPKAVTWTSVLGACRKWKNVEVGSLAFQSLVSLDERDAAAYVQMAHIYGSRGMWEEQGLVLGMKKHLFQPDDRAKPLCLIN